MNSIDEVLVKLDRIIEDCYQKETRVGYFAILYRKVTQRVKEGIEREEFDDNSRMERLDVLFAKRFTDAYDSWQSSKTCTKSWKVAFEASEQSNYLALQHLFLGINAHINLDLGIAASETMGKQNIEPIQNDFNQINSLLSELVDGVKSNLSTISPLFGWLIPLAKGKDEILLNFSIQVARDGAWKYAGEYHRSEDKIFQIQDRDRNISTLGKKLINPGKFLSLLLKVIGFLEWKSVKKVMDQLN